MLGNGNPPPRIPPVFAPHLRGTCTSVSYCTRIPFGCFVSDRRDIRPPTYKIFEEIYTGSERVTDLAFQIEYDMRVREVKFVIEVGFSETCEAG